MISRRNFFTLLASALAALGFKPHTTLAPFETDKVTWGPGIKHPHWRVPIGRWVVDDPDKVLGPKR